MTVIVMKKDLATLILEIVFVTMAGMVFLTAHFVSLESISKNFFSASPSSSQLESVLFIFGTNI